jgi:hypothetical protein
MTQSTLDWMSLTRDCLQPLHLCLLLAIASEQCASNGVLCGRGRVNDSDELVCVICTL